MRLKKEIRKTRKSVDSSESQRNLGIHAGEVEGDAEGVVCILCV